MNKYILMKYNIMLIAKPLKKLKFLVHWMIKPIHNYEKSVVYTIPLKIIADWKHIHIWVWPLENDNKG